MYEQYYTEQNIGAQLVKMLPALVMERCVELSAGQGALLEPVVARWPNAEVTTCELDPKNVAILREKFIGTHHNIDVLDGAFEDIFEPLTESFDLAVSNPPYCWKAPTAYDLELIAKFELTSTFKHSRLRAEVLFILQNLRLLRDEGFAAFILPELIINSALLAKFRERMLSLCSIVALTEIKVGEFKGTEARTYILVIQKDKHTKDFIYCSVDGVSRCRSTQDFVNGLRPQVVPDKTLYSLFHIQRGNLSGKECKSLNRPYYHTSGFFPQSATVDIRPLPLPRAPVVAKPGDILISRVGTRVVGNIEIVTAEEYIISDCVFLLRFNERDLGEHFISFWNKGVEALRLEARGTCAKYIIKDDVTVRVCEFLRLRAKRFNESQSIPPARATTA